jgi:hypothetical protein
MAKETKTAKIMILFLLVIFQAFSGLIGGLLLVIDPTGELLQIPVVWLRDSPFVDYLIPGWILLIVLGLFPLIVTYGLLRQLRWARPGALIAGIALIIWIGVQIIIIGYHPQPPLQLIYTLLGILIVIFALLLYARE